jgi:hypothetical protein
MSQKATSMLDNWGADAEITGARIKTSRRVIPADLNVSTQTVKNGGR